MHLLERFHRAVDAINQRIGSLLRWLALVMVLVGAYNAVARWATRHVGVPLSSNALNEAQWYLFSAIFLLGAAYGLRHDVHVRVDVLYSNVSGRVRAWIDLLGSLLFLVPFSLLMLWVGWPSVRNSWVIRETSPDPGGLPRYPVKALVLVCFALLLLQALAEAARCWIRLRGGGEDLPPPDDAAPADAGPPAGRGI